MRFAIITKKIIDIDVDYDVDLDELMEDPEYLQEVVDDAYGTEEEVLTVDRIVHD